MTEQQHDDIRKLIRAIKREYRLHYGFKLSRYKLGQMTFGTDVRTVRGWEKGNAPFGYKLDRLRQIHAELHRENLERSTISPSKEGSAAA